MRLRNSFAIVFAALMLAAPAHAAAPAPTSAPTPTSPPVVAPNSVPATDGSGSYTYEPEGCEFRVVFPEQPADHRHCDPDHPDHCGVITSFTHVFGIDATVDFNVTCNPAEPNAYDKYSAESMRQILEAMVGKDKLKTFQTGFKQFDAAKQSVIIGTGRSGSSDEIYMAQLWIGHQSSFFIHGELIGQQNDNADKMFADILKSIRYKDWKPGQKPPAPADAKPATTTTTTTAPATSPAPPQTTLAPAAPMSAATPPLSVTTVPDGKPATSP